MRLRVGLALVGLAAVGVASVAGYQVLREVAPLLQPNECTATVDGHTVTLEPEQAENAALITAIAIKRGMPARAATIALATAYQESKLFNIDYGDRDSLGLFQQRPSQGWGTPEQVIETLTNLRGLGCEYVICYFPEAAYDRSGIELFEREVIPALQ